MSILIPVTAAVLLALLCLPRLRKDPRVPAAMPEPEQTAAAAGPRPPASPTRPFAYDNGLIIGEGP